MPFLQSPQNSFVEMKTEFSISSYKTDLYHIVIVCDYAQCKHNQDLYLYCIFVWYMVVSIAICIMFFWIFSGACQFPLNCYTNHIRLEVYWLFLTIKRKESMFLTIRNNYAYIIIFVWLKFEFPWDLIGILCIH